MISYETNRLLLRSLILEDSELLIDYLQRNRNFLKEWEPIRNEGYYTLESVQNRIEDENKSIEDRSCIPLYIINKGDNKIIGKVSLTNIVYGPFLSCYLGYNLDEKEINKGKITEALSQLIEIAFKDYKLHRIEANIIPRNIRSKKVAIKLGFTEEGLSKKYLKISGKWEDHIHYVLLNQEIENE